MLNGNRIFFLKKELTVSVEALEFQKDLRTDKSNISDVSSIDLLQDHGRGQ